MRKKLFNLFALLLMAVTSAWAEDMKKVPLTLEAKTAGTIVVSNPQSGMKYKKNNDDIVTASSTATITINVEANDIVEFYGNGTSITRYYIHDVNNENDTQITGGTAECYIYGNIMSLVNETGFATATTLVENAFNALFSGNDKLYNHASNELVLPATTLANYCYLGMFSGCSNLTTAPALPATTLADHCYWDMFNGCSKLETAPELPATTLTVNCYNSMFRDCTELTTAPELPATTLTNYCYEGMFSGCSKLNSVTCLATNISASYATNGWLYGVAASGTFTKASTMTGWSESPTGIPTGWTVANSMKTVPLTLEAKTAGTIVVSNPKVGMQYSLDGGTTKNAVPASITVAVGDKVAFYGNGTDITSYWGTTIAGGTADCYIYGNIMSLVDETGFATATTLEKNAFNALFSGNAKLYNHASNELVLPATTLADYCYFSMFLGCSNLTTAPALPATTLADNCYGSMFSGCSELETAPALPATTLAVSCYNSMFRGCTELTTAPELPATTLAVNCYEDMFNSCSKLNSVTCLATNISADFATKGWLYGVATSGTFTKASTATWSSGETGIPTGWTVADKVILNDNTDIASQLTAGKLYTIEYTREFTADKPSTVCLPFDYAVKTGEQFYTFIGITKDGDEFVATMTEYTGANLVANTPYLYVPTSTGATDFSGTYTLPAEITAGTTVSGNWTFVGTYTTQTWNVAPTGIYGFSAQNANDGITQGEFVKVGAYVRVKPMRCYLMYKNGTEDYHSVRSFSGAPSTVSEPLPERIKVRFIDADGEVTGIGMLDTQTGEVSFDSEAWYTLDGVRLAEKPTKQGIYIHNGKKVIVK